MAKPYQQIFKRCKSVMGAVPLGVWIAQVVAALYAGWWFYFSPPSMDELGSWGLAQGGLLRIIDNSILAQGQGPVYFVLLAWWIDIFGDSIVAMRALSLLLTLVTLSVVGILGKILHGDLFASFLAVVFLASPTTLSQSFLIRPYALANFLLVSLLVVSLNFARSGGLSRAVGCSLLGALIFLTHYVYCLAVPFIGVLVFLFSPVGERVRRSMTWCLFLAIPYLVSIGGLYSAMRAHTSGLSTLAYALSPSFGKLVGFLFQSPIIYTLMLSIGVKMLMRRGGKTTSDPSLWTMVWLGVVATCAIYMTLWILALVTGASLLIERYLSAATIFSAIGASALVVLSKRRAVLGIGGLALALIFHYKSYLWWGFESRTWKAAVDQFKLVEKDSCEIFACTGFIELQNPRKCSDPKLQVFLKSPLSYYESRDFQLLPLSLSDPSAREYFEQTFVPRAKEVSCLVLILSNVMLETDRGILIPMYGEVESLLRKLGYQMEPPTLRERRDNLRLVVKAMKRPSDP